MDTETVMRKVFGVIISWNPEIGRVRATIRGLQGEGADGAIIADNDSRPEIKEALKSLEAEFPGFVTIIWNPENGGIGGALNPGAREAVRQGADWIMTTEDDNGPEPGMLRAMFAAYDALPPEDQERVGLITPNHTTVNGFAFPDGPARLTDDGGITSGQLVKTSILPRVGLWNEDLFIDAVDGEFSFRVYRAGFRTLLVPRAILRHRLGHSVPRSFFGRAAYAPNYPPLRYYYMSRNAVYLYIRNFREHILHNNHWYNAVWAIIIPRFLIKAMVFEDQKWEKLRMAIRGAWDGIRGHMGKMST